MTMSIGKIKQNEDRTLIEKENNIQMAIRFGVKQEQHSPHEYLIGEFNTPNISYKNIAWYSKQNWSDQ